MFANVTGATTLRAAFYELASGVRRLRLATPFFSYGAIIEELAGKGRDIHLIVRLGPITVPGELAKVLELPTTHVRFFTSPRFHSKLYIFGDRSALVGSGNLTDAGLQRNREIAVTVGADQPEFHELVMLFEDYWSEATVLTSERLATYQSIWTDTGRRKAEQDLERNVMEAFGDLLPSGGIQVGRPRPSRSKLWLEDYERTYQQFLGAFREIEEVYRGQGRRKTDQVPLRIEVDQFFNYLRERHAPGDEYRSGPLLDLRERKGRVQEFLAPWFEGEWSYLTKHIVPRYAKITERLGSTSAIKGASAESLLEALEVCHAFSDQFRFHRGGMDTLRRGFLDATDVDQLRESLLYLLHGPDPFVERMGTLIFDRSYRLPRCGRSVVQELLGWVNQEDVPICNGRTLKMLRFLGYDVPEV